MDYLENLKLAKGDLFPKSGTMISAIFEGPSKPAQPPPLPNGVQPQKETKAPEAQGTQGAQPPPLPKSVRRPESKELELTDDLKKALFPETPVMISALFTSSEVEEIRRETTPEPRDSTGHYDRNFPIL